MPDAASIICRRCGTANTAGDQFCGSCGAFLEWEGQPAEPGPAGDSGAEPGPAGSLPPTAATNATNATPVPSGMPEIVPSDPIWPPEPGASASPSPQATSSAAADADAGLIRCPSCGIANPATRTFCQSCGTTLAQAARVVEPDAAAIAAAVARQASVPRVATTPVPPAAPRAGRSSRGFPRWIFVIGGLGILVGVGAVAASMLLSGPGPGSIATSAPETAAPSTAAVESAAVESAAPSPTPASVQLSLTSATASSVVGNRAKFAADMAIDGNPKTCWQEGKPTEKGQWIEVTFAKARVDAITMYNGYQLSDDAYFANLRLKDITVSINGGDPIKIRLEDVKGPQRFELGAIDGATKVRVTIVSTYASKKTSYVDSPFDDAALSEIAVEGTPQ